MARRKPRSTPLPTIEQLKALLDTHDQNGQCNFVKLLLSDPNSIAGRYIVGMLAVGVTKEEYLEERAGIAPEQIDPEGLLTSRARRETDKQIMKRTNRRSTDAVKTARQAAKKKLASSFLPPFSSPLR
jgi:hypothetical protein